MESEDNDPENAPESAPVEIPVTWLEDIKPDVVIDGPMLIVSDGRDVLYCEVLREISEVATIEVGIEEIIVIEGAPVPIVPFSV